MGALVAVGLAATGAPALAEQLEAPPCKPTPAQTKISPGLESQMSLLALATTLGTFTCQKIVIDAELSSRTLAVTVVGGSTRMTVKELGELFRHAVEATGLMVSDKRGTLLVMRDPKAAVPCAPTAAAAGPKELPPDDGVKLLSATHVQIERATVAKLLDDPAQALKSGRIVPNVKEGKPDGYKIFAVRAGSLFARMGILNGDVIKTWNGVSIDDDEAYRQIRALRTAKSAELGLVRRGAAMQLHIEVIN